MKIQILGTGCAKCQQLAENAESAAKELGLVYTLEKIENVKDIASMGVMATPALAVDDKVLSSGKLLNPLQIKEILPRN